MLRLRNDRQHVPAARRLQQPETVKKLRRRTQRKKGKTSSPKRLKGPWMSLLALMAAESRQDGGLGLQLLLQHAKFDVRPHLSLQKHAA